MGETSIGVCSSLLFPPRPNLSFTSPFFLLFFLVCLFHPFFYKREICVTVAVAFLLLRMPGISSTTDLEKKEKAGEEKKGIRKSKRWKELKQKKKGGLALLLLLLREIKIGRPSVEKPFFSKWAELLGNGRTCIQLICQFHHVMGAFLSRTWIKLRKADADMFFLA